MAATKNAEISPYNTCHALTMSYAMRGVSLTLMLLLAACVRIIPHPQEAINQPPPNALALGLHAGPPIGTLALTEAGAEPVLLALRQTCPHLTLHQDHSGITQPSDWQNVCYAAAHWPTNDASDFFISKFDTALVGTGASTITGYYEPEIAGTRTQTPGYDVPIYGVPSDLVHANPGDAPLKSNGQTPFGRYDATGHFTPYYTRAQIEQGAIADKAPVIGWAIDKIEFFFLQIQGSGLLKAPDGSVMRIGYAADNGQNYTAIGAIMHQQGLIGTGQGQYPGSMQGIMNYLHDHPKAGQTLMDEDKSWVFFRETTSSDAQEGPIGALGVPVNAHVSLAADPLYVPLGAPVVLTMDSTLAGASRANGLWIAEDTGGAIKGPNRFDSFWGTGEQARLIAGGMIGHGQALILLPHATLARLGVH